MSNYNPQVTKYIDQAPDFEQPILNKIREMVHECSAEIEEKMRWGFVTFDYKGKGLLYLKALKERVNFGFWFDKMVFMSAKLSPEAKKYQNMSEINSVTELPPVEVLQELMQIGMDNIAQGKRLVPKPKAKKELVIPDFFIQALAKDKLAEQNFAQMSPSHKKEYVEWIVEAKTDETRNKRIAQMLEQLKEKKSKNWKYQK